MKVIGINTCARADGNTAILINTVFEELNKAGVETELIQLAGKAWNPVRLVLLAPEKATAFTRTTAFAKYSGK